MISMGTLETYGRWFDKYHEWVCSQYGVFTPELAYSYDAVRRWLGELQGKYRPATVRVAAFAVRYFARMGGYKLDFERGDLPSARSVVPEGLGEEEVWRLIGGVPDIRDRAILALMYDCALRLSELVALNVSDIDLDDGTVFVRARKGADTYGLPQRIPLSERARRVLEAYLKVRAGAGDEPLFLGRSGGRISRHSVYMVVRRAGERILGKRLRPHVLRHTRAIVLRQKGWRIEDIRDFLGHINIKTTTRYARIVPTELKKKLVEVGEA